MTTTPMTTIHSELMNTSSGRARRDCGDRGISR
jgi:hypothetical protein